MVHSRGLQGYLGNKGIYNNIYYSPFGNTNSWNSYSPTWTCWDANEDWITPIVEKPGALGTFYCPRRERSGNNCLEFIDINVTTDYGATWSANPTPISRITSGDPSWSPYSISFCDANPNILYISTRKWLDAQPPLSQVWRTTDGGQNWQNVHNGVTGRMITSVVADPGNQNIVYLTVSGFSNPNTGDVGHIFKSNDKGDNWYCIDRWPSSPLRGMPDLPANYMVIRYRPSSQKEITVATDAGVCIRCVKAGIAVYLPLPVGRNSQPACQTVRFWV